MNDIVIALNFSLTQNGFLSGSSYYLYLKSRFQLVVNIFPTNFTMKRMLFMRAFGNTVVIALYEHQFYGKKFPW